MPEPKTMPDAEYLRALFCYDPATGELQWRRGAYVRQRINLSAGGRGSRYTRIGVEGRYYLAHRVIWKWMTGQDPPSDIDHVDRDGFNNRWANLRLATKTQAVWNRKLPRRVNLPCGVMTTPCGKWRARIMVDDTRKHLGTFSTVAEAAAAYEAAARELHGEFYRLT
jgi:hypothetical protein